MPQGGWQFRYGPSMRAHVASTGRVDVCVALCAAIMLAGCSASHGRTEPHDAGSERDGDSAVVDSADDGASRAAAVFVDEMATAFCQGLEHCLDEPRFESTEYCRRYHVDVARESPTAVVPWGAQERVASGSLAFVPARAAECLAELRVGCPVPGVEGQLGFYDRARGSACEAAFVSPEPLADGAGCRFDAECSGGSYCSRGGRSECGPRRCTAQRSAGAACEHARQCRTAAGGIAVCRGTCEEATAVSEAGEGEPCGIVDVADTVELRLCEPTAYCWSGIGVCMPYLALDAPCDPDDRPFWCPYAGLCEPDETGAYRCVHTVHGERRLSVGSECPAPGTLSPANIFCDPAEGLLCDLGQRGWPEVPPLCALWTGEVDDACGSWAPCRSGLHCSFAGRCEESSLPDGAECIFHTECASSCCQMGSCASG